MTKLETLKSQSREIDIEYALLMAEKQRIENQLEIVRKKLIENNLKNDAVKKEIITESQKLH